MNNNNRYSRQILVSQFGDTAQKKLQDARVLIVGAGGLGCTVATHLAGAGVGELILVDHDKVSISNLHRQILFREDDLGRNKAELAKQALAKINSEIKLTSISSRLSTDNVSKLCHDCDLIIDAADTFLVSFLLSDTCLELNIPMLSASVNQTFGTVSGVCGGAPSLRAIFPRLPQQATSCDTVGVTGPSVGIIASVQAQEALKLLIASNPTILGKIIHFDLWTMHTHQIDFSSASEPTTGQINIINASDAVKAGKVLIDVRDSHEITSKPQTFAVDHHIPLASLQAGQHNLNTTDAIALCCQSGQRALIGAQSLLDQGVLSTSAIAPC